MTGPVHLWSTGLAGVEWSQAFEDIAFDGPDHLYTVGAFGGSIEVGGQVHTSAGGAGLLLAHYSIDGTLEWLETAVASYGGAFGGVAVDGLHRAHVAGWFGSEATLNGQVLTSHEYNDIFVGVVAP